MDKKCGTCGNWQEAGDKKRGHCWDPDGPAADSPIARDPLLVSTSVDDTCGHWKERSCDCPDCAAAAAGTQPGYIHCKACRAKNEVSGIHEVTKQGNILTIICANCGQVVGTLTLA